jgi:hypothetical protein
MLDLHDREIIPTARRIVQICLEEIAAEGQLLTIALRPDDFVGQLATGMLADCLQSHQLKLEMIERWSMEIAAYLLHACGRCACGHVLRSDREYAELHCMECRVMLLRSILPCGGAE